MTPESCRACGLVHFPDEAFCRRCGEPFLDADAAASATATPYGPPVLEEIGRPPNRRVQVAAALALLVVVIATIGGVYGAMSRSDRRWQVFRAPDGSFSVALPGSPREQSHRDESAEGALDSHVYTVGFTNGEEYMVMVTDLPDATAARLGDARVLDAACEALTSGGRRIVERRPISIGGHSGTEVRVELPDGIKSGGGIAEYRIVYARPRVYQIAVATNGEPELSTVRDRFFESFSLQR